MEECLVLISCVWVDLSLCQHLASVWDYAESDIIFKEIMKRLSASAKPHLSSVIQMTT